MGEWDANADARKARIGAIKTGIVPSVSGLSERPARFLDNARRINGLIEFSGKNIDAIRHHDSPVDGVDPSLHGGG